MNTLTFPSLSDELFYKALRIRLVEERVMQLYPFDKIQSPVHLSIGQEAVAVGACHSLELSDLVFGSYRSHAFYLAKGGDLPAMFAELYGKETGCGGGKAGSMHLAAPDVGLMGSSAVVASTIPHAVGAALAAVRRGTDQVIVSVFGDGAVEEGVYHESMNFAALHRLPVIFLCENNGLAVHSKIESRHAFKILDHAKTYGMKTTFIEDGFDFLRINDAFSTVAQDVRAGNGPHFVEIRTFRYMEHVGIGEDFSAGYRDRADLEIWKAKDPLTSNKPLIARYATEITEEIDAAIGFAEQTAFPGLGQLLSDVI
jgi:TPP-dependent pyruvate/acetoin dehydrogenase alpha subunit